LGGHLSFELTAGLISSGIYHNQRTVSFRIFLTKNQNQRTIGDGYFKTKNGCYPPKNWKKMVILMFYSHFLRTMVMNPKYWLIKTSQNIKPNLL